MLDAINAMRKGNKIMSTTKLRERPSRVAKLIKVARNALRASSRSDFLARIERQYGKARRVWCMDRGVPTEEVLAQMRASDPPVHYLVGTPKGRLTRLEEALLDKPWHIARPEVRVKLLAQDSELYVFAESRDRIAKERSMRRRQLKWL